MNRFFFTAIVALILGVSLHADSNVYGKVALGYEDANNFTYSGNRIDAGSGLNAMLAVGYRYNDFALEGEYSNSKVNYTNTTTNYSNDITVNSFILNFLYHIDLKSVVTPYLGAGIGTSSYYEGTSTTTCTTYEGTAGISWSIKKNIDVTLEYKYRKFDVSFNSLTADDVASNSYMLGLLYKF